MGGQCQGEARRGSRHPWEGQPGGTRASGRCVLVLLPCPEQACSVITFHATHNPGTSSLCSSQMLNPSTSKDCHQTERQTAPCTSGWALPPVPEALPSMPESGCQPLPGTTSSLGLSWILQEWVAPAPWLRGTLKSQNGYPCLHKQGRQRLPFQLWAQGAGGQGPSKGQPLSLPGNNKMPPRTQDAKCKGKFKADEIMVGKGVQNVLHETSRLSQGLGGLGAAQWWRPSILPESRGTLTARGPALGLQ